MKKTYNYSLLILILSLMISCNAKKPERATLSNDHLYGPIPKQSYVSGQFDPAKHPNFVCVNKLNIPTDGRKHYLHQDTAQALIKMLKAFHQEYPKIKIYITSSTRNFDYQKRIWNAKWQGHRLVEGQNVAQTIKNPVKRGKKILRLSSMPGTSRHHWGSDFDINTLENYYYNKGKGKIIYIWLTKNAAKYGFAQPYTADRDAGYSEEKWHWSYLPLAKTYLKEWEYFYQKDPTFFIQKNTFCGAENLYNLALPYVTTIADTCK